MSQVNLAGEVIKIIYHYFPDFMKKLRSVKDPRNQSYIIYSREMLLLMRIFAAMAAIGSMRQMTEEFNQENCIENLKRLIGEQELKEIPYWETINNFLSVVSVEDIEKVNQALIYRLIRMRCFETSRIRGKYWQILVDGTQLYRFTHRHCAHCLKRVYNKGKPDERTEYYHEVLEAKLYVCDNCVFSIATEFVENENEDVPKQDCERKAFYRLAAKLKASFKRLPICLSMDSLYACEPVFALCRKNDWRFLIRFKDGSLPSVAKEFLMLRELAPLQVKTLRTENQVLEHSFVSDISYGDGKLNCLQLSEYEAGLPDTTTTFTFLTDFTINVKNVADLAARGRARWKIENQGFNCQKNHDYFLSHTFSKNQNAMKAHYLLIQIAHMLVQLAIFGLQTLKKFCSSVVQFRKKFLEDFKLTPLPWDFFDQLNTTFYVCSHDSS